jgi:hypothetical protein
VTIRSLLTLAAALLLALAPEVAQACAVCGSVVDEDRGRIAYLVTAGVLSLLPLAVFGAFLLWLRARHRRQSSQPRPHAAPRPTT